MHCIRVGYDSCSTLAFARRSSQVWDPSKLCLGRAVLDPSEEKRGHVRSGSELWGLLIVLLQFGCVYKATLRI